MFHEKIVLIPFVDSPKHEILRVVLRNAKVVRHRELSSEAGEKKGSISTEVVEGLVNSITE